MFIGRVIKTYALIGFSYNALLMSMTRINTDDPNFKKFSSLYYRKIFYANIFRLLCFPYSMYEYINYPKIRSLTYPPNRDNFSELYNLYNLEFSYESENDLTMKDVYMHLYVIQRRLIYQ